MTTITTTNLRASSAVTRTAATSSQYLALRAGGQ
jgi:hypothetical protein